MSNTKFERTVVRNTKILGLATFAWVFSMAIATFGPEFFWESKLMTLIAILVHTGFGLGMILANMKHISALDELQQRIQLVAMGISLGVAVVIGLSLSLLESSDILPFQAEISFVVVLVSITYMVTLLVANKRYG
jgi:hypothetical protein